MRGFIAAVVSALCCAQAQQVITTAAGTDFSFPQTPIAASSAPVGIPIGVAVDSAGNLYVADNSLGNNLVFQVSPQGVLTIAAGNGTTGYSGDGGPATSAALNSPGGVAVDAAGELFVVDSKNERIRKVSAQGIISTVAGNGIAGFSGDGGEATSAELNLNGFGGVAVDAGGNLYIVDQGNNRIRKVTTDGIINTVAGTGSAGYTGDGGQAASAALNINANTYVGAAVDAGGNLYIADYGNSRIRKVSPGGIISTVAGNGNQGYSGDGGPAVNAALDFPSSVAVDAAGNFFITDLYNIRVREVAADGIISTVAGSGALGYTGDGGPALAAAFTLLTGVAVDASDNLFLADQANYRIREVTSAGVVSTFVGNGQFRFAGDGGLATSAALNLPSGVAVDASGNLYIADILNDRIRQVTGSVISTAAGSGEGRYSGDGGPANEAHLLFPYGVAVDGSGNLFIADTSNNRIRKVAPGGRLGTGIISTVAGNGTIGYSGDGGPATSAELNTPTGIAVDASGNIYIADYSNNRVRKVTPGGVISTVAGTGSASYSGDGGEAVKAALNLPTGVAVDGSGNLFIADSGNDRIREVTPDGTIQTVAGNGTYGFAGDGGQATSAELRLNSFAPYDSIAVDALGNLFIADTENYRIRKVTPGGIISTVAGDGFGGYSGDGGPATSATLTAPSAVAVDAAGNLYIADTYNYRIRVVLATAPNVSVSPQQLMQFSAASNGAPTAPQTLSVTSPVEGLSFSATVPAGVNWLQLNPSSGASPRLIQVSADPTGLAPDTYQTTITIDTPNANPTTSTIAVTFVVTAAVAPALSIDKASLSFPFPQQGSARSQTISVSNNGGGALPFTVVASTSTGGQWLSVSPASGQALPGSPVALTVTANPAGLSAGAYSGQIAVTAGAQSQVIPVTMTISALDQAILLSQSGLSFQAVQGGGVVPAQSFGVTNIGASTVNWTVSTSTLAGGAGWLQVTPAAGSSEVGTASPRVTVSVNGSALAAGTYYGLVRVDAPGAANTPQVLTVFLQVLPANSNVAGVVQPAQLLFTATAGGESPGSQVVQVFNIVEGAKSFRSQVTADQGLGLIVLPQDGTLDPQQPTNIVVQPVTNSLSDGVYNGTITLEFSDGRVSAVQVTVIVSSSPAASGSARRDVGTSCIPTKLFPALVTLGQSFAVSAGWPTALLVNVKDDCGNPLQAPGSVTVSFSNGDQPLALQSQGGGGWENTWQTGNASSAAVTLTIQANNAQGVTGKAVVAGNLGSQQQPPVFDQSGIAGPATALPFAALAPGAVISIYGNRLAESTAQAQTIPLPPQLVDTQVYVAGGGGGLLSLPLYYVSQNQVNAMIPYEVSVNTTLQLLVQRGNTYSVPVQIDMARAEPAVFSTSGAPGSAGLIQVYPASGGQPYFASASAPAHAGDTIVLYCTGLGAVNPGVGDGAAPGQQLSNTVSAAQLIVGGQTAQVNFAGLTPGFAGLYQVNAVLPAGTPTGANVPVTLAIDGQTSAVVTLAIQ